MRRGRIIYRARGARCYLRWIGGSGEAPKAVATIGWVMGPNGQAQTSSDASRAALEAPLAHVAPGQSSPLRQSSVPRPDHAQCRSLSADGTMTIQSRRRGASTPRRAQRSPCCSPSSNVRFLTRLWLSSDGAHPAMIMPARIGCVREWPGGDRDRHSPTSPQRILAGSHPPLSPTIIDRSRSPALQIRILVSNGPLPRARRGHTRPCRRTPVAAAKLPSPPKLTTSQVTTFMSRPSPLCVSRLSDASPPRRHQISSFSICRPRLSLLVSSSRRSVPYHRHGYLPYERPRPS